MPTEGEDDNVKSKCDVLPHAIPSNEFVQCRVEHDPHSEQDIADYVHREARDETVQHIEHIKQEVVLGDTYEIWGVTTDKDRWWVITNLTNLYSQKHFPSLDFTLSFHIGLMMRLRSRSGSANSDAPTPFEEVFRRQKQAEYHYDRAVEAEDYKAVGMQLRECLLSLASALRRRVQTGPDSERPQDANFVAWSGILMDKLCAGKSNKKMRHHLKNTAKETWQLVNWLTHDRDANKTASSIAIHACGTIVGHFVQILERERTDWAEQCPLCKSRNMRTHFDISIELDGDYYMTCGACNWSSHPSEA